MGIAVYYKLADLEASVPAVEVKDNYVQQLNEDKTEYVDVPTSMDVLVDGEWMGELLADGETVCFSNKNINNDLREALDNLGVDYQRY